MTTTSENLFSASDLRRLSHGSYEYKIEKVQNDVCALIAERLKLPESEIVPVATYEDRMVFRHDAKFYSAHMEFADNGDIYVTRLDEEDVDAYDSGTYRKFAEKEAALAVDAYLKGDVRGSLDRISQIVQLLPSTATGTQEQGIATIEGVLDRQRLWKQLLENRRDSITRFLVNHLETLEKEKLSPKFSVLYSGNLDESDRSVYAEIVDTDLAYVTQRYATLETSLSSGIVGAQEGVALARTRGSDVVDLYEKFATDLLEDVQSVNKFLTRVLPKMTGIEYRGKLRDTLVERLDKYEIAGCFATEVAGRLAQMV